ncbi:MAG: phenylalanine--tRNA ligase subunit alpha [Bacilli bacterium]|jgi:phenylalanyl-tRNA synthetase alpha chain|nr:phenylalanine--tRNA ligase subunit alpha [Bacilli bacterium]
MISELKQELTNMINDVNSLNDLQNIKVSIFGKKGRITLLTKDMKDKTIEERRQIGQEVHQLKEYIEIIIKQKELFLIEKKINDDINNEAIDIYLPGMEFNSGTLHPLTITRNEIESFFNSLGFAVIEGNEIESDEYNFEKMNIPKDHPARDMQDTFYFSVEELLRTHTSPMQARTMEANAPDGPIRVIVPGKTYRRDEDDLTHSHQFMQIEGLVIDKNISLADLKGTLELFAKNIFGSNTKIRFRPSYFPFTEPSVEVDVTCHVCHGQGCSVCKQTGWIEILGAGQVHPNVIDNCGYDSNVYQGFAFGMGVERVAMIKYGIDDIRLFYNNNLNFLKQFDKIK